MDELIKIANYSIWVCYTGTYYVYHTGENNNKPILCGVSLGDALIFVGNRLNVDGQGRVKPCAAGIISPRSQKTKEEIV